MTIVDCAWATTPKQAANMAAKEKCFTDIISSSHQGKVLEPSTQGLQIEAQQKTAETLEKIVYLPSEKTRQQR